MKTILLLLGVSLTATSLWSQTTNPLPRGILSFATRAVPVPRTTVDPAPDSLSKSNIAGLALNASRATEKTIEPADGGARAEFGLQKTFFPVDVKDGPVVITTPDGRKLSFRATFLALHDLKSGHGLLIAEVTNRVGAILGDDEVIYTNAFDTLDADIRYRYTPQSLEQDIILHEHPPIPSEFSPENTRLEVWTEWFDSEPVSKATQRIDLRSEDATGLLPPSLIDDDGLNFGTMKIVMGHSFSSTAQDGKIPVGKSWMRIDNRDWLIETVDYLAVKSKLDLLPNTKRSASFKSPALKRTDLVRRLAKQTATVPGSAAGRMQMAQRQPSRQPEFVMDFIIVSSVPVPSEQSVGGRREETRMMRFRPII